MHAIASFLGTGMSGANQGELDFSITPSLSLSSINFLIDSWCSGSVRGCPYFLKGFVLPTSISCTHFHSSGKSTSSQKTAGRAFFTRHLIHSQKVSFVVVNALALPFKDCVESSSCAASSCAQWTSSMQHDPEQWCQQVHTHQYLSSCSTSSIEPMNIKIEKQAGITYSSLCSSFGVCRPNTWGTTARKVLTSYILIDITDPECFGHRHQAIFIKSFKTHDWPCSAMMGLR